MKTFDEQGKRKIGSTSAEAKAIFEKLKTAQPGDEITYAEINQIIGRDVRKYCKSALDTARKMCMQDQRIVFDVIPNVGLKRLQNEQIPKLSRRGFKHIRNTAKKYVKVTMCADYEHLSHEGRLEFNYALTGLEPIRELSSLTAEKRIKEAITDKPLLVGKALELFTGK